MQESCTRQESDVQGVKRAQCDASCHSNNVLYQPEFGLCRDRTMSFTTNNKRVGANSGIHLCCDELFKC